MEQYEGDLESNLQSLENRLHRESYRPNPSLRVDIPEGKGQTRPLGIACIEDKLVQRAVVMILERIYEEDFLPISFGFRPKKSCYDALSVLGQDVATAKVNGVSDADIKGFFNNVDDQHFMELLAIRVSDPKMLRLAKLRGYYQYYGVNDNWPWLMKFRQATKVQVLRWLNRRSQKTSKTWTQFDASCPVSHWPYRNG